MVQNQGTDAMAGLNPHTQRSTLPGASAAGAACAKAADLFLGVSDLGVAIDVWMAGMYHRRPMLDPQLERIGVGYASLPDGMLTAALRFENATRRRSDRPVAYPADKQTDVPLDYGAEFPNPIPNHGSGGYAITLQFPPFDKVTGVTAKLTDAKANPVEFFLSDPEHPATSFGQFGVICLIPKQPLQPQHVYSVRIDATWKGKSGSWTWSFSTVSLRGIEASDDRAITGAINVASLVHGTVAYDAGLRPFEEGDVAIRMMHTQRHENALRDGAPRILAQSCTHVWPSYPDIWPLPRFDKSRIRPTSEPILLWISSRGDAGRAARPTSPTATRGGVI